MACNLLFCWVAFGMLAHCAAGLFDDQASSTGQPGNTELRAAKSASTGSSERSSTAGPVPPVTSAKLPAPSEAALKAAEKEVADAIGDPSGRGKSKEEKAKLAAELVKTAAATNETATQFVLLRDAQNLAGDSGEIDLAITARNQWVNTFQVDSSQSDLDLFERLSREATTAASSAKLCGMMLPSVADAIAGGHYDVARSLARLASAAAQRSGAAELTRRAAALTAEITASESEYNRVAPSMAALRKNPNDAEASGAVGRFLCLWKDDWDHGLPLMAKGSDVQLKAAAQADLANPGDASEQAQVADEWWKLADSQSGAAKNSLLVRAAFWYQQASPALTGLEKILADKRLDEFARLALPMKVRDRIVNLMPLIDPVQDAVDGTWTMESGELLVSGDGFNRLRIPYYPPSEYDFHIRFKRLKGNHDVCQMLRHAGRAFIWIMGAGDNHLTLFANVNNNYNNSNNPTMIHSDGVLENDQTHDSVVQVRKDFVAAYLDGKLVTRYPTDYSDLSMKDFWSVDGLGLGIGSYQDSDSFSVIEVVEVTGIGRRLSHER